MVIRNVSVNDETKTTLKTKCKMDTVVEHMSANEQVTSRMGSCTFLMMSYLMDFYMNVDIYIACIQS